jgi:indole-3-glycerol phosphate synthase
LPILRKDFIVDEYQIYEAKSIGADVILLIAAALTKEEVHQFAVLAKQLGLEVLLEIHNKEELLHDCAFVDMIGVNNRNLSSFEVDINLSIELFPYLPKHKPAIAESGLTSTKEVNTLKAIGYKGFLIGESLMKGNFSND